MSHVAAKKNETFEKEMYLRLLLRSGTVSENETMWWIAMQSGYKDDNFLLCKLIHSKTDHKNVPNEKLLLAGGDA